MSKARTSPVCRISYPALFSPRSINNGAPKYSVVLMLDKSEPKHVAFVNQLQKDVTETAAEQWPDPKTRPRFKSPIKDGDTAVDNSGVPFVEKNPEYAGHFIIRCGSTAKPPIVDRNNEDIIDPSAVSGGDYCRVNLNAFAYAKDVNKGVTFGLNGVQFVEEGERFGGGRPALADMFGDADPLA